MNDIDQPSASIQHHAASGVPADSTGGTRRGGLFLWLVAFHFVLTCGLSFAYYEMIRIGAASRSELVFDLVGCLALYLAAGLIAAGRIKVRGFLFASTFALAQAAWIWRWLPGWWLIPTFGAALSVYGWWIFRGSVEK